MKYQIYKIEEKEVLTPSTDYYARHGDSDTENINYLSRVYIDPTDTFEESKNILLESNEFSTGEYTILPIFTIFKY